MLHSAARGRPHQVTGSAGDHIFCRATRWLARPIRHQPLSTRLSPGSVHTGRRLLSLPLTSDQKHPPRCDDIEAGPHEGAPPVTATPANDPTDHLAPAATAELAGQPAAPEHPIPKASRSC